jgi:hypothetical protein
MDGEHADKNSRRAIIREGHEGQNFFEGSVQILTRSVPLNPGTERYKA